ncbi:hypothetical protein BKA82DRAFT_997817 [Pisolithus tinctorius]|uniref:Uncharacterized protein n=1 Tax=Pisolithus tinctorius Marx 270 TaxID=870435 RepID=A0A0C3KDF4_PISTI|nr:hypothetical protein BKA82DRAFT_997817 [Pisolithus tinctorius]KIO07657.1 hypothetical protein M404DRAFT_997817 [Pisolithus tinctorius Marx 270]
MAPRSRMMSDQQRLSEQLQLLSHFEYSDLHMSYPGVGMHSNKATRNPDTNNIIRILDTIAVALTTGAAGDVYAAAFDTRGGLTLVLAKNDVFTPEDDAAVLDLCRVITAPQTFDARDVFPFLFTRCGANIKKRIMKMDNSVGTLSNGIEEVLKVYKPALSVDEEFPLSADYRALRYGDKRDEVPAARMIRDLLEVIKDTVQHFNSLDQSASRNVVYRSFSAIVFAALVLQRSLLLRSLCESETLIYHGRTLEAERLKRHLAKVCQYSEGITELIEYAKRYLPDGIEHRWVNPIQGTVEAIVQLDGDYTMVIQKALGGVAPTEDTLTTLRSRFPDMRDKWSTSSSIKTRLHAEIRILLHLSVSFDENSDHSQQQPIGCSKRSCLCCTLWIWAYNDRYGTNWLTSGSHGKPYSAWALPGGSNAHAWTTDGRSAVDKVVMNGVQERLTRTIYRLFPKQRRYSAEHRSSASELGGSDSEGERMANKRNKNLANDANDVWNAIGRKWAFY